MASKRKSTTPCMIPLKTMVLEETDTDLVENYSKKTQQETHNELLTVGDVSKTTSITTAANNAALSNGYQSSIDGNNYVCKYCDFGCRDVNKFVDHMSSEHLDFSRDPSYVCIECSFLVKKHDELKHHNEVSHSGETSFIWNVAKHDNHITVEQSISDTTSSQGFSGDSNEDGIDGQCEITITKTPIMKIMKSKMETKKIHTVRENMKDSSTYPSVNETRRKKNNYSDTSESVLVNQSSVSSVNSSQIITSSMIGTLPILQSGVTQIMSVQQQPLMHSQLHQQIPTSECLPKVMIPLSSIPTYNATMDSNSFLKNSFNKFPYPTKAELCYLTVVTKYPEEQIKIWFTAQRLKQGISWSPEEIEDARKKMFNTVFQPVPQPAFTVLNAPLVANAGNVQQLIHTAVPGQFVGQPKETGGLLVSQPVVANGVQGTSSSLTLAVSSDPNEQAASQPSILSANVKVVNAAQSLLTVCPNISSQHYVDPNLYKNKKSHEQLSALKNSFCKSQFPAHSEVERLTRITGLAKRDVRKWFSDRRYHYRNYKGTRSFFARHMMVNSQPNVTFSTSSKGPEFAYTPPVTTQSATHTRRQSWHQSPDFTPTKYKERAPEQVKALEDSFAQNSFPSEEEVDRLRTETKMTRREVDSWFSDKRKKIAEEEKEEVADLEDEDGEENYEDVESSDELRIAEENESLSELNSNHGTVERKVSPIKINLKNLRVTESNDKGESQGDNVDSQEYDETNRLPISQKDTVQFKKTLEQQHFLKKFFVQSQWPTNQEYDSLAEQLGLQRHELVRWFGDSRYSFKNGQLKWFEAYRRGIYPPHLADTKANSHPVLEDYFEKYSMLCDNDLESLCEKTQMTEEEIKMWFAVNTEEEEFRAASDAGIEDQNTMFDYQQGSQQGTSNSYSEESENSECWKPSNKESCSESFGIFSQQSRIELEAD
uniref:Zinc fingers and homeoboxes protein 3 n=1 Tax=Geotrypetes seraphini TaxID=260995 RepID=A0A6P8SM34_GEOSA|nr:zinc fingers and homeoboxes protein 3 [Geotrypetes seraphini]XP_033819597.1 zinc fingers and homeoboxes protein 3 [Geotrypetes seraphini]